MAWAVSPAALAASPRAVSAESSGSTMGAGLATSEAPQRTRQLCWQRRSGLVTDLCSGLRSMLSDNGKVEALVPMPCLMVASAPSRQRVGSSLEPNEASPVDSPLQPAHSLAVQAFKHEEESAKSLKRREHLEQDKCGNDDPNPTELSRGKSVRFLFAVFYRVIIKVGKRLRYLTKHPHSGIQAMATDLFGYWKKVVLEETGKKNGSSENERSNNSASRVEKAQPMKVEKNSASASVKVEKRDVDVRGQKSECVKVEKIANNDSKAQPVKVERVSKEVSRTPDTKKPSSVPNGPPKLTSLVKSNDATRDKIRELLADAFSRVSGETSKDDREEVRNILDEVDACDPFRVSVTVESALFERLGRSTGAHKAKYRSIMFNLRADNNTDFRRRVLLGQVRPERLVDISPEEMASDARKLENKQIKEKALFDCERGGAPKATTDQFKCGRCGQRKTTYYQLQTRSADEPMTTFVTCVNCNNHWKFC